MLPEDQYLAGLHFIDGTYSHNSYAVLARREDILLGIRFTGMLDGALFGISDAIYLHARVRSARSPALVKQLEQEPSANNVVEIFKQNLTPAGAWPKISFDKVDNKRASLMIGLFVGGPPIDDPFAMLAHIKEGEPFRKLFAYVIRRAGQEHRIARAKVVVDWLVEQAKPALDGLKSSQHENKVTQKAQSEFKSTFGDQPEAVAPHLQHFNQIYQKHKQAGQTEI